MKESSNKFFLYTISFGLLLFLGILSAISFLSYKYILNSPYEKGKKVDVVREVLGKTVTRFTQER